MPNTNAKMYFPPPDEETQNNNKLPHKKSNRKRKRKFARKNSQTGCIKSKKKQHKLAVTMSAWAESYTVAATWQLKHQLAYWKARAKALEFENNVLHNIIKKKNYIESSAETSSVDESEDREDDEQNVEHEEEDGDLEVSEEFIQFLQANAKYKEDARREREKLKAQTMSEEQNTIEKLEAGPSGTIENPEEKFRELYGEKWERVAALEIYTQSQFDHECYKNTVEYWPNIPFNFNFG